MTTTYYQQAAVSATKARRVFRVQIDNPANGVPSVLYAEEDVLRLPDGSVQSLGLAGNVASPLADMAEVIDMIDPETLLPTGQTSTVGAVFLALVSHYMKLAKARDAAEAAQQGVLP